MKRVIIAFAVLLLFACEYQAAPTFPNIGYLGAGYNLYYGSPRTVVPKDAPDPGYTDQVVFNLTIWGGTTPDERYRIPKGTTVNKCDACSVDFETTNITGAQSYQSVLDVAVQVSGGGYGVRFSASTDYRTVTNSTQTQNFVYTQSEAQCCVYKASLQAYSPPPLTDNFIGGVLSLPTTWNEGTSPQFWRFIEAFGTHYTDVVTMGGRFGQRSKLSRNSWSKLTSSDLTVSASASFSAMSFSAAVKVMTNVQKQQAQTYSKLSEDQHIFNVGGELPASFQVSDWIASSQSNPMPIDIHLSPLTDLLDATYFPKDPQISARRQALSSAYNYYCQLLLKQGSVTSCDPPPPSPPVPPRSIFGGIYQVGDLCHDSDIKNSYTGDFNCKPGYSANLVGRTFVTDRCIGYQYLCLLTGIKTDPLQSFGGMYQPKVPERPENMWVVNPLTGGFNCPAGYESVKFGVSVTSPTPINHYLYGSETYACYNTTKEAMDRATNLAGFMKWNDRPDKKGFSSVTNNWTHALSCPYGYKPYDCGFAWCSENTGRTYWCINNIYDT